MSIHLIFGGARSGKSRYAERLATASDLPVTYIATAQVYDEEFARRIAHHQASRPKHWDLVESPHHLAETLMRHTAPDRCLLLDCLTLWLAQCICPDCAQTAPLSWEEERTAFIRCLDHMTGPLIIVSNEVGMGIVPLGEINREFQDEQGRLNQTVAQLADEVTWIAAGLPLKLKG